MSILRLPFFMTFLLLTACVTINVYFPAAAAEKAADKIIDKVWGSENSKPKEKDSPSLSKEPTLKQPEEENLWGEPEDEPKAAPVPNKDLKDSKAPIPASSLSYVFIDLLDFFITPAYAAGPDLDISTPRIRALQNSMTKRHGKLRQGYINGAIGLTNNGLIKLRNPQIVPLKSRNKVKRLIREENQDRVQLYNAIANANGKPQWVGKIRQIFTQRWIEHALSGWWYQDNQGRWKRK